MYQAVLVIHMLAPWQNMHVSPLKTLPNIWSNSRPLLPYLRNSSSRRRRLPRINNLGHPFKVAASVQLEVRLLKNGHIRSLHYIANMTYNAPHDARADVEEGQWWCCKCAPQPRQCPRWFDPFVRTRHVVGNHFERLDFLSCLLPTVISERWTQIWSWERLWRKSRNRVRWIRMR